MLRKIFYKVSYVFAMLYVYPLYVLSSFGTFLCSLTPNKYLSWLKS